MQPDSRVVGAVYRLREIERQLGGVNLVHLPLPADDPTRRKPDIRRAIGDLGWSPQVPLAEGLERTVAAFKTRLAAGTLT